MYTETQIRAAGISGEISSIDVEHLINILKRENEGKGIDSDDFFYGWTEKGMIENPTVLNEDVFLCKREILGALQNKVSDISVKSEIIKIGSSLIHSDLSEFEEDWNFSKSMPLKDRRRVVNAIGKHKNFLKETAVSLKNISDNLIVNERKDSAGSWTNDKDVIKTVEFGDYISVEQKRYGCANEFYTHKVIGTLKSNVWMDVPAITHEGMSSHSTMEEIVACICEGVCEEKVIRYRIKDIHSIKKHRAPQPQKESK